jgi:hypothetical protein
VAPDDEQERIMLNRHNFVGAIGTGSTTLAAGGTFSQAFAYGAARCRTAR